jgi:hypothetical protein
MFRSFCQLHNLTPLRDVYADKGRSGFSSVIVVEAWDRLGRHTL